MSVALLSHLKTNVEICDELQSFYYVMLHHAVQYLQSNFDELTVVDYIGEFFDQYGYVNKQYTCGDRKLLTMLTGRLAMATTELVFASSAVNTVLHRILSWFHAHHIVTEHARRLRENPVPPAFSLPCPSPPLPAPGSPTGSVLFTEDEFPYEDEDDIEPEKGTSVDIPDPEHRSEPTPRQRELANLVTQHDALLKFLKDALEWDAASWANSEKVGDRVPETWRPDRKTKESTAARTSNKRPRLDNDVQSEPFFRMQLLLARLPITPPGPSRQATAAR